MINNIQAAFLELLRSAIWDKDADPSFFTGFTDREWRLVTHTSRKRSVSAMIADKILSLPAEYLPSREFLIKQMMIVKRTELFNERITTLLEWISDTYGTLQAPFVLLKGSGVGQNYPKPSLRTVVDLDLFLYREGDYEKVNQWVADQGFVYYVDPVRDGHRAYKIDQLLIENHKHITFFERKKYNTIFGNYLNNVVSNENFSTINIGNAKVKILPPEINGCYIFIHLFFHFIHEGVGFKQFCDWILFLAKNKNAIDKKHFTEMAASLHLLYAMQLFARVAVDHLGANADIFPFSLPPANKYCNRIIEDILMPDNFSLYQQEKYGFASAWLYRIKSFTFILKRVIKFFPIAPSYTLVIPFSLVINRIKLTLKGN
jgi:hypothetical protein